jgi:hypothetical protein
MRKPFRILVAKSTWRRSFGTPRGRWENKMDLTETLYETVEWFHLARTMANDQLL